MKSVLISIQPKWCELIASGEKTVEVRKTRPKLETPFKVYIYETQGRTETPFVDEEGHHIFKGRGQVIGEFVCDSIMSFKAMGEVQAIYNKFHNTCLTSEEIIKYASGKRLFYWYISNLVIYDKPRELSEFSTPCKMKERLCGLCDYAVHGMDGDLIDCNTRLSRPPQSWCYVEVRE